MNTDQLNYLMRKPAAYMKYRTTGELPNLTVTQTPLLKLLSSVPPSLLVHIRGLQVDGRLGYTGSRVFHTAAQAKQWIDPQPRRPNNPSESWIDRFFNESLTAEDLIECSTLKTHPNAHVIAELKKFC